MSFSKAIWIFIWPRKQGLCIASGPLQQLHKFSEAPGKSSRRMMANS